MNFKSYLFLISCFFINPGIIQAAIPVVGGEAEFGNSRPVFTFIRTATVDDLTKIITEEAPAFLGATDPSYAYPNFRSPTNSVDIYRVTYPSLIPELGNKPTIASGLIAIPKIANKNLSVVSYQHGTVWGKLEVPSHSFYPTDATKPKEYALAFETRLAVSQFAGNGYIVIAADYFGLGDAAKNTEAYGVKGSHQQATLDLYKALQVFLLEKGLEQRNLFLSGWSQGGLVTMQFLEKIEREGITVKAASTAAGPTDLNALVEKCLYEYRASDAPWVNTVAGIATFSHENYYSAPDLAHSFINPDYYDTLSKFYERKVEGVENPNTQDLYPLYLTLPSGKNLKELFLPEYSRRSYYKKSKIAALFRRDQAYKWKYATPVIMFYGDSDEVVTPKIAMQAQNYQKNHYHSNRVKAAVVIGGSHRGTFFSATAKQRDLFDSLNN